MEESQHHCYSLSTKITQRAKTCYPQESLKNSRVTSKDLRPRICRPHLHWQMSLSADKHWKWYEWQDVTYSTLLVLATTQSTCVPARARDWSTTWWTTALPPEPQPLMAKWKSRLSKRNTAAHLKFAKGYVDELEGYWKKMFCEQMSPK